MKITIWHKSGAGTEMTADDFAYIEVDGKDVWNVDALKQAEAPLSVCLSYAYGPKQCTRFRCGCYQQK